MATSSLQPTASSDIPFSLHQVTIEDAVSQGLVGKINATRGTHFSREEFLARCRASCRNEDQWQQEYMARPATDSTAWLPYDLIQNCETDERGRPPAESMDGSLYLGMDVGETGDLTVIWTLARVGDVLHTVEILTLGKEALSVKESALLQRLKNPKCVRGCVDATGVGAQIAQAAVRQGKGEAVKFTQASKDAIATPVRRYFEDRRIRIPASPEVREDLHSVRMTRTAAGNARFDAARSEVRHGESATGHADRFWALALAIHAAETQAGNPWMS